MRHAVVYVCSSPTCPFPVSLLFGIQLGGGTDITNALAYAQELVEKPSKTHLIVLSDLEEYGDAGEMLRQFKKIQSLGVRVIVLLSLNDEGAPNHSVANAQALISMGIPVFACSPDQFPIMMGHLLCGGALEELMPIASIEQRA